MTEFEKYVLGVIKHFPQAMCGILKQVTPFSNVLGVLKKYFPYSLGIELEVFDEDLGVNKYYKEFKKLFLNNSKNSLIERQAIGEYTIRIFKNQHHIGGLVDFYKLLMFLKDNAPLNITGAIHIHVDCTDISKSAFEAFSEIDDAFMRKILVASIDFFKYCGKYNDWDVTTLKNSKIRIHNYYQTLEFRMGLMTYEFDRIFNWLLGVSYLTKCCKHFVKKEADVFNPKILDMFELI